MMSRMNDCVPLGSTGYPFAFPMNVDAGSHRCRTGSASHCPSTVDDSGSGGVKVFDRERDQHHQFIEIYFHGHLVELANLSTCEVVFRTKRSPESLGHLGGRPIAASYCNGDFVATLDLSTHVYEAISTAS